MQPRAQYCTLLVLLAVTWPFMACRQSSNPAARPIAGTPPSAAPASYSFEVRSDSGSATHESRSGNFDATIGDVRLRVQDGVMTVNEQSYGQIREGDAVLVQSDGQVIVNLQVRVPR